MYRSMARGFTLIEVMIVVVIISILATIAIPAYSDYVTRSKIQEATSTLLQLRTKVEQYYQDQRSYIGICSTPPAAPTVAPLPTGLKYFTIDCNTPAPSLTAYTIRAVGGVAGGDQSMAGFIYTIDEGNNRRTTAVPSAKWGSTSGTPFGAPFPCFVTKTKGIC